MMNVFVHILVLKLILMEVESLSLLATGPVMLEVKDEMLAESPSTVPVPRTRSRTQTWPVLDNFSQRM